MVSKFSESSAEEGWLSGEHLIECRGGRVRSRRRGFSRMVVPAGLSPTGLSSAGFLSDIGDCGAGSSAADEFLVVLTLAFSAASGCESEDCCVSSSSSSSGSSKSSGPIPSG